MKYIKLIQFVFVFALLISNQFLNAQTLDFGASYAEVNKVQKHHEPVSNNIDLEYHGPTDRQAYFPGGLNSLVQFVQNNMEYPEVAQSNAVEGTVVVQLGLNKKGEIESAKVLRSPGFDLDKEALRIVSKMPSWEPALEYGQATASIVKIAIVFRLR